MFCSMSDSIEKQMQAVQKVNAHLCTLQFSCQYFLHFAKAVEIRAYWNSCTQGERHFSRVIKCNLFQKIAGFAEYPNNSIRKFCRTKGVE